MLPVTVKRKKSLRGKGSIPGKDDFSRTFRLVISIVIVTAALIGRRAFPVQMEKYKILSSRDIDFSEHISAFKESEFFDKTLEEFCVGLFGEDG